MVAAHVRCRDGVASQGSDPTPDRALARRLADGDVVTRGGRAR